MRCQGFDDKLTSGIMSVARRIGKGRMWTCLVPHRLTNHSEFPHSVRGKNGHRITAIRGYHGNTTAPMTARKAPRRKGGAIGKGSEFVAKGWITI